MKQISRTNQILAAVLVLQMILAVIAFWPKPAASQTSGKSLFEGVAADKIVRVSMRDVEGNELEVAKSIDTWVLPNADDYPIQQDKGTQLAEKLAALTSDRVVTETSSSLKRLKVADDDYERLVTFEADGKSHTIFLGSSPSWSVIHARLTGQNQVYLVSGLSLSDVSLAATSWIDTQLMSVPQDEIVALTLKNKNGGFEFTKDDAGVWSWSGLPAGQALNESNVKSLASRAGSLYLSRPLGKSEKPEYGMSQPNALVTVERKGADGKESTFTVTVGAKMPDDNTYVLKTSESPYYVLVAEYAGQTFSDWGEKEFVQQPTPTPASTAASQSGG